MESIVRNVSDIASAERQVYEHALGHQLGENQQVFIMVVTPNTMPSDAIRTQAFAEMERLARQAAASARRQGVSEQEINDAIEEAVGHVRRLPEK